jgi:hypothetical protein
MDTGGRDGGLAPCISSELPSSLACLILNRRIPLVKSNHGLEHRSSPRSVR